jgi:hypothetical protein
MKNILGVLSLLNNEERGINFRWDILHLSQIKFLPGEYCQSNDEKISLQS